MIIKRDTQIWGATYIQGDATISGSLSASGYQVTLNPSSSVTIGTNGSSSLFVNRNAFFSKVLQNSGQTEFTGPVYFYGSKVNYNSEFQTGATERGYCGVGGTAGGSANIAGVGVNYRMKKTYTPNYIQLTPSTSTANAYTTDLSNEGFFLYIQKPSGTSNNLYYYWRGYYYA